MKKKTSENDDLRPHYDFDYAKMKPNRFASGKKVYKQTFIVLDPAAADPSGGFVARLEGYLDQLVSAPTVPDAPGRVLIAGEPEADAERRSDASGIAIDAVHATSLEAIGERAGIPFPAGDPVVASGTA
jgi:LDH2 family malate/lactate/ureidoglycolate dehydrogenase